MDKLDDLKTKEREIELMLRGARHVLEGNTFEVTARKIFDTCCELTGARSGYVALLTDDGEENEVLFLDAGGMPCSVDPELPMPIRGLREESYRTGRAVYHNDFMNSEFVDFMPEGHVVLRNVLFSPLNLGGKTVGIIGLANKDEDFTDRDAMLSEVFGDYAAAALNNHRALDKLKVSQRETKQLNELLKNINLTLRHDIKNRLTFVRGVMEMIHQGVVFPKERIKMQLDAIDYCIDLSDRMKNLEITSEDQAGLHEVDVIETFRSISGLYNVKMEYEGNGTVMADDAFRSLVDNIIANSLNHGVSSKINVRVVQEKGSTIIEIKDNGKGFHESSLPEAFTKGYSYGARSGSGFGLHLVRTTMERYGGVVDIGNSKDGGAIVRLIFPANI